MSADRQPRHRRASLLRRLTTPAPDTAANNLAPVPHEPPPTMLMPKVTVVPVGAMVPGSIVARTTGLRGEHATAVLPALRHADRDATQVMTRVRPAKTGKRLSAELTARYDVLLNAFDEQVAAEAAAWDALSTAALTDPDLSPYEAFDAHCADIDNKVAEWVCGDKGIKRFNRDRANRYYQGVVRQVRAAHTALELWVKSAGSEAELSAARWEAHGARDVAAPTDTIPKLTPALLSAMDAVRLAEARVAVAGIEAKRMTDGGESR